MADLQKTAASLVERGFTAVIFDRGAEAAAYLDEKIDGKTVGFGGSMTLKTLGLYDRLSGHNQVVWHWEGGTHAEAAAAQVYLSSANALAESGELINIDGAGNRVASTLFGHEKVYFVVGKNKIAPSYEEALWRARNIAAPQNAKRLGKNTPCAIKGDRCYDCKSPERICRALTVLWEPMMGMETEIVLINEDLGF
ncbi:MAG: lactate utilization protein [Oscillibacter sp.]